MWKHNTPSLYSDQNHLPGPAYHLNDFIETNTFYFGPANQTVLREESRVKPVGQSELNAALGRQYSVK